MTIRKVKLEDIAKYKGRTKKEELDSITDAEISESVLGDADSIVPTEKELDEFGKPKSRGKRDEKED